MKTCGKIFGFDPPFLAGYCVGVIRIINILCRMSDNNILKVEALVFCYRLAHMLLGV